MLTAVIQKITAFISAIIVVLFNLNIIEPIQNNNPPVEIVNNGSGSYEHWGTHIISSYSDLIMYSKLNYSENMKDFLAKFNPDFFIDNTIIIEDVMLADSAQKTYITSLNQINNEVNLEYVRVNDMLGGCCAIHHDSICIIAKKPVTKVNINDKEKIHLPFISQNEFTPYFDIIEIQNNLDNSECTYFIKDFDSWNKFISNGFIEKSSISECIDNKYFDNKNLGIIITSTPNSAHEIRVSDFNPFEKNLNIDYYSVSQPRIGVDIISDYMILVYTDKNVESFSAQKHELTIPFNLDGSLPN